MDPRKVSEVFDHDCVKALRKRGPPEIVNDQGLRELRANNDGMFAMCSHCPKTWTNTEFVTAYLKNGLKVVGESKSYSDMTRRLRAACVDYQNGTISTLPRHFVQVGYNHHRHAKSSCFKKFKEEERQKRSSVGTVAECRYRYPKKASRTTKIINSTRKKQSWFTWKGTRLERYIKEAIRQRSKYDVFQNISCKSVSYSKLTCNSNLTLVMEGPVGMYNTKYNIKNTQVDERKAFEDVSKALERTLQSERKYEKDFSEAMRRLLSACFAHQKSSIVGGSMCSFLTRNHSRFIMSHEFSWCPLRDISNILKGQEIGSFLITHGETSYFQNNALHYLCRPKELNSICAHDFYSKYEVVRISKKEKGKLLKFSNDYYQHPSYCKKKKRFLQGIRPRKHPVLVNVFQYDFPDSAQLGGNLADDAYAICLASEVLSEKILLLFASYRVKDDILINNSYTRRLQKAIKSGEITSQAEQFLQNLQDCRSNNSRMIRVEDELERCTLPP